MTQQLTSRPTTPGVGPGTKAYAQVGPSQRATTAHSDAAGVADTLPARTPAPTSVPCHLCKAVAEALSAASGRTWQQEFDELTVSDAAPCRSTVPVFQLRREA